MPFYSAVKFCAKQPFIKAFIMKQVDNIFTHSLCRSLALHIISLMTILRIQKERMKCFGKEFFNYIKDQKGTGLINLLNFQNMNLFIHQLSSALLQHFDFFSYLIILQINTILETKFK